MKKFFGNLLAFVILILFVSVIVSWIGAREEKILEYEPGSLLNYKSRRMKNISYSLPLSNTTENNWRSFNAVFHEKDRVRKFTKGFLTVDSEMYTPLRIQPGEENRDDPVEKLFAHSTVSYAPFELVYSGIAWMEKGRLKYDSQKLKNMMDYYRNRQLLFSDVRGVGGQTISLLWPLRMNLAAGGKQGENIRENLKTQFEIAEEVLSNNGLRRKYLVIDPGFVTRTAVARLKDAGQARERALENAANNLVEAMADWYQANPGSQLVVLLENTREPNRLNKQADSEIHGYLGRDYRDLIRLRQRVLNLNPYAYTGRRIENAAGKISLSIHLSNLISVLNHRQNGIYLDDAGKKMSLPQLGALIARDMVNRDFQGKVVTRFLERIVLSYHKTVTEMEQGQAWQKLYASRRSKKEKDEMEIHYLENQWGLPLGSHLPYTRATNKKFLLEQMNLAARLLEVSRIGRESHGVVHFDIPPRVNFPLAHQLCRPLVESTRKYLPIFIHKPDGASREELVKSLEWVHHFLYNKIP